MLPGNWTGKYPVKTYRHSHSTSKLFEGCARKFELTKFFFHAGREQSLASEVGSCLHDAFQSWIVTRDQEAAYMTLLQRYPYELEYSQSDPRSLEAVFATFEKMMNEYQFLDLEIATMDVQGRGIVPCIEVPFAFRILENGVQMFLDRETKQIPITYVGKIDLIVVRKFWEGTTALVRYGTVDVKTTRDASDPFAKYMWDEQCIPYTIVLNHMLKMDIGDLDVTYLNAFVDLEKAVVNELQYKKTHDDVRHWARKLFWQLKNCQLMYDQEWFPRNSSYCVAFKKQCQFFDVCGHTDKHHIQKYLLGGAEDVHENPMDPWVTIDLDLSA